MHLAFRVDDLDATLGRLVAAGGSRLGEVAVSPHNVSAVYTRDPEGNVIELSSG